MILVVVSVLGFSFLIQGLLGRFLGRSGSALISVLGVSFGLAVSLYAFIEVVLGGSCYRLVVVDWIEVGSVCVNWGFNCDVLICFMIVTVLMISLLVHIYSIEYMSSDPHRIRFMAYLTLFTLFMIVLVTGDNLIQTLLGWEGVGLVSYLLVNFWFSRVEANRSALKAIMVNRVGDYGLCMAIILIYYNYRTFDYGVIMSVSGGSDGMIRLVGFLVCVGAIGKSAQIGLHMWLPDAMEGPTPVSALIHAATMVTAGVFILMRMSCVIELSEEVCFFLVIVGSLTALFAGSTGIYQNDIKKVIAYSTCSQLGFMVVACGSQLYSVALFHLVNHAFFKALLSLSAGLVIHSLGDEQDMRRMGGLVRLLPISYMSIVVGSLALSGFSFLSGFYSKELIIMGCYLGTSLLDEVVYYMMLVATFRTSFYSFRVVKMVFFGETRMSYEVARRVSEEGVLMRVVLCGLVIGSVLSGFFFKEFLGGFGVYGFGFFDMVVGYWVEVEMIEVVFRMCPIVFGCMGVFISLYLYDIGKMRRVTIMVGFGYKIYTYFVKKWCVDMIYNELVSDRLMRWGYNTGYKLLDRGLLGELGTGGILRSVRVKGKGVSYLQSGYIYHYVLELLVSVIILFIADRFILDGSFVVIYIYLVFYLVGELES
jgi:proton-translocating NADH-quinone oxidoreductase chain L